MRLLTLTLILFLFPLNVKADNSVLGIKYKNYISTNKNYINALKNKQTNIFKYIYPDCNEEVIFKRLNPKILLQPYFISKENIEIVDDNLNSNPHIGQWIESTIATSCNESTRLNILTTAYNENEFPIFYPLINGKTKIKPLSQSLAEDVIYQNVTKIRDCRTSKTVLDTLFLGYRSSDKNKLKPNNQNLGWFEQWTVNACNKIETVNLAILPDPKTKYRYIAKIQ